jgi:hypothetical protein
MADLNLRNVAPELIAKLKSDAALSRTSLRDHCVFLLTGQGAPETPTVAPVQRPAHDPATCRVYNCGMCKAVGK